MNRRRVLCILLFVLSLTALSAKPKTQVPDWLPDFRAVYPSETYIAAVARYLKTDIQTSSQAETHAVSEADDTTMSRTLDTQTAVSSTLSLSALEYTEPNAIGDDPLSILSAVDIKIESHKQRTVYTKSVQAQSKTVAFTLENAQKKAYPLLAQTITMEMTAELKALLGNE